MMREPFTACIWIATDGGGFAPLCIGDKIRVRETLFCVDLEAEVIDGGGGWDILVEGHGDRINTSRGCDVGELLEDMQLLGRLN